MSDQAKIRQELLRDINTLERNFAASQPLSQADTAPASLRTVSVPDPFAPIFLRAQEYVERYFRDRVEDPEHSTITISGERYILVRAASMSVEFFDLVMSLYQDKGLREARSVANNLLFDIAHAIGKADAHSFQQRMQVEDPIERLSAGPIHFSFSGWAFVKIFPESSPTPDENYFLIYDHPFSFEADAWLRQGRKVDFPVCIMNAGYSSGWCEESFGIPLVAAELECQAKGDPQCRFIMATPAKIEQHLARYITAKNGAWVGPADSVSVPEFFQRKRMEDAVRASEVRFRVMSEPPGHLERRARRFRQLRQPPLARLHRANLGAELRLGLEVGDSPRRSAKFGGALAAVAGQRTRSGNGGAHPPRRRRRLALASGARHRRQG
jgi:predicted hydrocarbon binding protein